MSKDDILPNLVPIHATEVRFCVSIPAAQGDLAGLRVVKEAPAFAKRSLFGLHAAYRAAGRRHEIIVGFGPRGEDQWHVHVAARLSRRSKVARAHRVVWSDGEVHHTVEPCAVRSSALRRVITALGACFDSKEALIYGTGEFRLALAEWTPLLQVPFELVPSAEGRVGLDVAGVRLGWHDGSRTVIMEAIGTPVRDLRVHVRVRSQLSLGTGWLQDVAGHMRECLADVIHPCAGENPRGRD